MAKRDIVFSDSGIDSTVSEPEEVWLRSLHPANWTVAGPITGKKYHFPHNGSEVKVDKTDAIELLKLKRGGCCGGAISPYVELVQ